MYLFVIILYCSMKKSIACICTMFIFDCTLFIASMLTLDKIPGHRPALIGLLTSIFVAVVLLLITCASSIGQTLETR